MTTCRYEITVDESYARKARNRYFRSGPLYRRPSAGLIFIIAVFAGTAGFWAIQDPEVLPMVLRMMGYWILAMGILLFVIIPVIRARRLRLISAHMKTISVILSDGSVTTVTDKSRSESDWSAYKRADRYEDGIMLVTYRPVIWLPDCALVEGSPEATTSLVATKMPLKYRK